MAPVARPPFREQLTEHFTVAELTVTRQPFPNVPPAPAIAKLRRLCRQLLEPWRLHVGPIVVSSGYRSPEVNRAVGGQRDSQHLIGEAADCVSTRMPLDQAWRVLVRMVEERFPLDQGIIYVRPKGEGWVHVSYTERRSPRRELLVAPPGKPEVPWHEWRGPLILPG